ncbi:glycosyltransferase family 4 protein [Microseira sp. BLCC-F43]|uniref:glycosyltransferase family 4 protein n=1 Tax=Microseira sp. BLCC-F43 TaxID=3153602 RepID=UPI0035B82985
MMLTESDLQGDVNPMADKMEPAIALLPWGDVWEDFLDSIGVSLETFCTDGPGGWMLGYMDGLRRVGVRTVLILISARVDAPVRYEYAPTDSTIVVLPVPKGYRAIRRQMLNPNPYLSSGSFAEVFGDVGGVRRIWLKILNQLAPYLATPLGLVAQELRRYNCSAIFCQDYESARFDACVLLGRLMGLPVLATFQGGSYDPNLLARFLLRRLTVQACGGLAIGPQTEIERVCQTYNLPSDKTAQIFNPIDLGLWNGSDRNEAREKLGIPAEAQVVVWHGRIEFSTKRLDLLLDAWEQICRQRTNRDLRLHLMGTGQDAEKLRDRIEALPMKNVLWLDKYVTDRTEIQRFLCAGDVYAFPSIYEGFPVAPIEAMACGLPLVAAAASGVPDILKHGEASGGLVVPRSDVAAFTLALGRILDDPDWGRELGKRARRRVEEYFSLEVVGGQLRDLILKSGG